MKKKFIYIITLTFISLGNLYSQDSVRGKAHYTIHDFVSVRITTPYTTISLYREGFIYSKAPFINEEMKDEAFYIPSYKLNQKKVLNIIEYIHAQNLLTYPPQKGVAHKEKVPIVISFIYYDNFGYSFFNYYECDPKIEYLIKRMNKLIPMFDRKKFRVKKQCVD